MESFGPFRRAKIVLRRTKDSAADPLHAANLQPRGSGLLAGRARVLYTVGGVCMAQKPSQRLLHFLLNPHLPITVSKDPFDLTILSTSRAAVKQPFCRWSIVCRQHKQRARPSAASTCRPAVGISKAAIKPEVELCCTFLFRTAHFFSGCHAN